MIMQCTEYKGVCSPNLARNMRNPHFPVQKAWQRRDLRLWPFSLLTFVFVPFTPRTWLCTWLLINFLTFFTPLIYPVL